MQDGLSGRDSCPVLDAMVADKAFARSVICIVGAGLSGIEAAKIFSADEPRPVLIVEKADHAGGIWVRAANVESRVQVDPVSFAPIEDAQPVRAVCASDCFDTMARPRAEVLSRLAEDARPLNIAFRTEVLAFTVLPDSVLIRLRLRDGAIVETEVAQLHVRTGCLDTPVAANFPNAHLFEGRLAAGVGSDIALEEFAGKRVVIVGMGAFAVENVRRALQGGAASITVVARSYKPLFPEYATYQLRRTMAETNIDEYASFVKMWRHVHQILVAGARACGAEELSINEETVRWIGGEPCVLFANGVPPMSCNTLLLALSYGACSIVRGTVAGFVKHGVTLDSGAVLEADVVVSCLGFSCNDGIMNGHLLLDSWLVDGYAHATMNLRGDRVNGTNILGANARGQHFLISYYEDAQEYERAFVLLNRYPEALRELREMEGGRNWMVPATVDYFTTLDLSRKLASLSHPAMRAMLEQNRRIRQEMYRRHLPPDTFKQLDKEAWTKMSAFLAKKTGATTVVDYPFDLL